LGIVHACSSKIYRRSVDFGHGPIGPGKAEKGGSNGKASR